jgi:phage-related minor tail protein
MSALATITTISTVLQLIPTILEIIKAVETQIPASGMGKEKLEFVKNVLSTAYPQVVEIWGMVEKIIAASVTLFNATGAFKK